MEYFVSSFSGNDANDGLSPATAKATVQAAYALTGNYDQIFLSNAAPHGIGTLSGGGVYVKIDAYDEPGGADHTIQSPLESFYGLQPRIAAIVDGSIAGTTIDLGSCSCSNITFQNAQGATLVTSVYNGAKVHYGCEYKDLNGSEIVDAGSLYMTFHNCWFHELGDWGTGGLFLPLVRGLVGCYFDLDEATGAICAQSWEYSNNVVVLRGTTSFAAPTVLFGLTLDYNRVRNNTFVNLAATPNAIAVNIPGYEAEQIIDNLFFGFDTLGSFTIVYAGGPPLLYGSNSYYDSGTPPVINSIGNLTLLDYQGSGDPFVDSANQDFRISTLEIPNNIGSNTNASMLKGAIQTLSSGGGGGGNIFIINE